MGAGTPHPTQPPMDDAGYSHDKMSLPLSIGEAGETVPLDHDLDMLRRWRDGDRESGAELLRRYKAFFHRTCARLGVRDDDVVVELFQEVVLGIAQDLKTLPERIEKSFAGWLAWRIRDAVSRRRRARRAPADLSGVDVATDADPSEDLALREALRRCAGRLPAKENRVFSLRFLAGLSIPETADAVSSNVNAVSQSVFRLSRRMRACLEAAGYGGAAKP